MNSASQALIFIIQAVGFLLVTVALLRFWMQAARVNYYDQLAQVIVQVTEPVLKPMRRIFPDVGRFSISAIVLALGIMMLQLMLTQLISGGSFNFMHLLLASCIGVLRAGLDLVFFILIAQAILSWVSNPGNPIYATLSAMTYPILQPIRRVIPSVGGLDLSTVVALIGIQALRILVGI